MTTATRKTRSFFVGAGTIVYLVLLFTGIYAALTAACTRAIPPSLTTPQARVAWQAEDALSAIGILQHATIVARRNNVVSTRSMRAVVKATSAAADVISQAIDNGTGAAAAYKDTAASLRAVRASLPAAEAQRLAAEFDAAQAILAALAPPAGGDHE